MLGLGDIQTLQASKTLTNDQATNHDESVGDSQTVTDSEMLALGDTQTSQASGTDDQATYNESEVDSQMATDGEILGLCEMSGNLTYDWGKDLQMSKAFEIPDSEPNSLTDQQLAAERNKEFEDQFMVPEPPSLSGIIDSTISIPPKRTISDWEETYIEDDMSTLTTISSMKVSNAPKKHEYGKERVERNGNIYNKFYNACLKGELSTIKDILKKRSTLMQGEDGQTPLFAACMGEHTEIVKLLIDFGYDVNHQDKEGKTPLQITFENHLPDLAQILITQFKANPEIRDKQNWTPLHKAINRGYSQYSRELLQRFLHQDVDTEVSWIQLHAATFKEKKQVQFLLDAGSDVNHVSGAGYAPLHIAVNKSNVDLVTLLLDQNVNVNGVTLDGKTALHIAVDKGEDAIIQKLLAQKADPSLKDVLGNTSLHIAVQLIQERKPWLVHTRASCYASPSLAQYRACSAQTVRAIIDHGADVNAENNRGQTALWFACVDGQESFVKILLNAGANPSIADKYGDSCLHAAILGHLSTESIQEILDHGAHLNAVNNYDGATPLLFACSSAQAESVELLLSVGADPNIADTDGDTSILSAISGFCSVNTMQKLVNYGAKVNAANKKGRTALLKACAYREIDVVKYLLEAGADPTLVDDVHYSSLHAAVDGRCTKNTLWALIDHGAYVDVTRKDGTNALLRACTTGQAESVMFLLDAGADVSITKPNGNTCLHTAVVGACCREALQKIIEQGINVNTLNNMGETALHLACKSAQAKSVKLLLEKGADPNISDANYSTSLHTAVHGRCTNETLQEIITHGVYLDAQDIGGNTAFWLACTYGQQKSIQILLEAGSNLNMASTDRYTSLHAAANAGCSKSIISAIISHGVGVNTTNKNNITALMLACLTKNKNAINVLFNAGADPNIANDDAGTCLHYAAWEDCSKEVLQAIINHGVDVSATNKGNRTALMIACVKGNEDALNVLLNAGTDPNIVDDQVNTCLHCAVLGDSSKEILQAIISHGVNVNARNKKNVTALMQACLKGFKDAINVLLNAGADPNIADPHDDTCLHSAASVYCSKEILQAIISHGVDVNATNKNNTTALMRACVQGNEDAINVLLTAGADPNITNAAVGTCLHHAALGDCSKEVFQAIINHGIDVNATNNDNSTTLMIACVQGNDDAINVLLKAGADPNIAGADVDTCLHSAVSGDCSKRIIQAIISHGADVNATNKNNRTALMIACVNQKEDVTNVLLNAGADPNITDANVDTCLHHAALGYCSKEVFQAIISHGTDVNATNKNNSTALMIACVQGNEDAINVLLNAGADPTIADADVGTYLRSVASGVCNIDTLKAMVNDPVVVNAINNAINKYTELAEIALSCETGNKDSTNEIFNSGADPNGYGDADAFAATCLQCAVFGNCSKQILQAIVNHGVDVNATNKNNRTALMIACVKGNENAINVLLNAGTDPNIADADVNTCLHYATSGDCSRGLSDNN